MQATEDIWSHDDVERVDAGTLSRGNARKDDDLGEEIDARYSVDLYENLNFSSRGGVFFPGKAAQLLVNGNTNFDETAWEWKNTLTFTF